MASPAEVENCYESLYARVEKSWDGSLSQAERNEKLAGAAGEAMETVPAELRAPVLSKVRQKLNDGLVALPGYGSAANTGTNSATEVLWAVFHALEPVSD